MRILAAGGGSGGHVIPVVAVFKEILEKRAGQETEIRFWCDKKFLPQAKNIIKNEFGEDIVVSAISSGKLRRYNHLTFWQHFTVPGVLWGNLVDFFKNIWGVLQSLFKLIFWRPDVIFCKGGFVCVPIGLAAWLLRIPIVTHDSDAHPGLANRILAKFARAIATGAPLEFYNYPAEISTYVGVPVRSEFRKYSLAERTKFKKELGYRADKPLVLITGGGLGAARLNNAAVHEAAKLVQSAQIVLVSGVANYEELQTKIQNQKLEDFHLYDFISKDMWKYLAAADLVVARAGATSNLELAALAKPTILVPNARLTGGHQVKNAMVYADKQAVELVDDDKLEDNPELLSEKISELLQDEAKMKKLSQKFAKFANPNSASEMADIVLAAAS
ncbi:MAG: UDP-N-acetylglucosamine--N-acetylmuramyl-(pentapeptide) pyrophosphoryl-undecaprenol N-acetylglucosamine transferase [Candidatus Sacchiramonaceae bacterium]|nr:UDP-N-acetylglucosamine--N-acetylmuramyl-(pentapeptide) pyrophosphoryl-undecaprenol N-acetylglucosamine transferase [Candidatus Saccharimonadaceae bacterium]